jgi:hypothetical protein
VFLMPVGVYYIISFVSSFFSEHYWSNNVKKDEMRGGCMWNVCGREMCIQNWSRETEEKKLLENLDV